MASKQWMRIGAFVKVLGWVGEIVDVAVTGQRIMLLVQSQKTIRPDWLEYRPGAIVPATLDEALRSADNFNERNHAFWQRGAAMRERWARGGIPVVDKAGALW